MGALALVLGSGAALAGDKVKGSAELAVGQESSTLDTNTTDKVSFLHRDRWTTNYQGEARDLHYTAFNYGLGEGFSVGVGLWGTTSSGVKPHIAVQYFGKFGDF